MNLPVRVWEHLTALANAMGTSRTEAVRRCISTEVWRYETCQDGSQLMVRRPDGTLEAVHFPY
jgi:hypothetical protein